MTREQLYLNDVLSDIYKPRSTESIAAWALRVLKLPGIEGEFSAMPYDVSRSPVMAHFFEWYQDEESIYYEFVSMKNSQAGETLAASVATAYDFANEACGTMYVSNTDQVAAAVGKARFVPLLKQADPEISEEINDSGEGAVFKIIKGCPFICTGGTVPTKLASWPIKKIHVDEAALHRVTPKGTTMDLASMRTQKQTGRKNHIFSKPEEWVTYRYDAKSNQLIRTSSDNSVFTERWMRGTQCVPMCPCPHCGGRQEFTDAQLRAPKQLLPGMDENAFDIDLERLEAETWYECVHCKLPIYEHHKAAMVAAYQMLPAPLDEATAKREGFARPRVVACDPRHPDVVMYRRPEPGVYSQHISDFHNITSATCTFGAIHRRKLSAERNPTAYATYCKDCLGEPPPNERITSVLSSKILARLRGTYERLQVINPLNNAVQGPQHDLPCEPKLLCLTADYQKGQVGASSYFPFLITAFDDQWRMWIVDYGTVFNLDDLQEIVGLDFTTPSGKTKRIGFGFMDSQHDPGTVHEFCQRDGSDGGSKVYLKIFPSAGVSRSAQIEVKDLTNKTGFPFFVYNYLSDYWEGQLYTWLLAKWAEYLDPNKPGVLHSDKAKKHANICPRPFLPLDADDGFFDQLSNMHETYKDDEDPTKGLHWDKIHPSKPNDYGDCAKLAVIIRRHFQMQQRSHPLDGRLQQAS